MAAAGETGEGGIAIIAIAIVSATVTAGRVAGAEAEALVVIAATPAAAVAGLGVAVAVADKLGMAAVRVRTILSSRSGCRRRCLVAWLQPLLFVCVRPFLLLPSL